MCVFIKWKPTRQISPGLIWTSFRNIQVYYKINRHFQRYVVSKSLAYWTHNLRSSVKERWKIFFQAFFRDVSTTSVPLTSLTQNGCYCGREGFLCAWISEDEFRYFCKASFQKTIWPTSTYRAVYLRLEKEISRTWLFIFNNFVSIRHWKCLFLL